MFILLEAQKLEVVRRRVLNEILKRRTWSLAGSWLWHGWPTSRAGIAGVVGGTFAAGVVSLSCAGISDKSLTIDSNSLIWHRWRCRSCSLSAAVGGDLRLVGSDVSWGGGVLAVSASACSKGGSRGVAMLVLVGIGGMLCVVGQGEVVVVHSTSLCRRVQ